jgi:hypothetical protein
MIVWPEKQAKQKWQILRRILRWMTVWLAAYLPARIFNGYEELFRIYERRGWHITPVGYYQPIPDSEELSDNLWATNTSMVGIDLNEQAQLALLDQFQSEFKGEYDQFVARSPNSKQFHFAQTVFCAVDAEMLYCMVRQFKPKRMIEVGSGMSTLLTAEAIRKNESEGHNCRFSAIEPYPSDILRNGVPGLAELLTVKVQSVPVELFLSLGENDILFIDSSHVVKTGGDVNYLYLEVIPRLNPGVIIHCHDIFLPAEYPMRWAREKRWFWTEQYLLQSFLAFNGEFKVIMANSFLKLNHPEMLEAAFAAFSGDVRPGSFWFRRVR